jgi:hypothetical protein
MSAGDAASAAAIRRAGDRIADRALAAAIHDDPSFGERYDEIGRQALRSDLDAFVDRLAVSVSAGSPDVMANFAEMIAVRYRKRHVPMDDVVRLCESLRQAAAAVVAREATPSIDAAIDDAVRVFRWHRRLAGDARKRNPLLSFLYKGA